DLHHQRAAAGGPGAFRPARPRAAARAVLRRADRVRGQPGDAADPGPAHAPVADRDPGLAPGLGLAVGHPRRAARGAHADQRQADRRARARLGVVRAHGAALADRHPRRPWARRHQSAFDGGRASAGRPSRTRATSSAAAVPASWASTKPGTSTGRMPANVRVSARATVTAGFANDVLAVNQYAAKM